MNKTKIIIALIVILAVVSVGTVYIINMNKGDSSVGGSSAEKGGVFGNEPTEQGVFQQQMSSTPDQGVFQQQMSSTADQVVFPQQMSSTADQEASQQQNHSAVSHEEAAPAGVTDEQILMAAKAYFNSVNPGDYVPNARIDSVTDDEWFIQLYEDMGDHTATCDWYTINKKTLDGTNNFGDHISLAGIISASATDKDISATPGSGAANRNINNNNTGNASQDSSNEGIVLEPGKYSVGDEEGQIPRGTYAVKTEGDRSKYFGRMEFYSQGGEHFHFTFGMDDGYDDVFNDEVFVLVLQKGATIEFSKDVGDFTLTLYRKE